MSSSRFVHRSTVLAALLVATPSTCGNSHEPSPEPHPTALAPAPVYWTPGPNDDIIIGGGGLDTLPCDVGDDDLR